uniref:Uncharacterized protein n=1 Tax=Graphocephala atropunctata TaxID=36148 RepID=A0A1B6KGZ7_9HEMI
MMISLSLLTTLAAFCLLSLMLATQCVCDTSNFSDGRPSVDRGVLTRGYPSSWESKLKDLGLYSIAPKQQAYTLQPENDHLSLRSRVTKPSPNPPKAAPAVAEPPKGRRLAKRGKTKKQLMMEKGGNAAPSPPTPRDKPMPRPQSPQRTVAKKTESVIQKKDPPKKEGPPAQKIVEPKKEEPPTPNQVSEKKEESEANRNATTNKETNKTVTAEEVKNLVDQISRAIAQALVDEQENMVKEGVSDERLTRARLQLAAFQSVKKLNRPLEDLGRLTGNAETVAKVLEKSVISNTVFRQSTSDHTALSSRTGQFSISSLSPVTKDYITMVVSHNET